MFKAICDLRSTSPYSQSRVLSSPRRESERPDEHEKRCWRERCHVDDKGQVYIPPMAFANSIKEAAKYASIKIPGQRNATYTRKFESAVMVTDQLYLGTKVDDVQGEWFFVPSDGKKGGGSRVMKCFPMVPSWSGRVEFYVLDQAITADVFERVLRICGVLIGVGRFRPARGGFYGRFECTKFDWVEQEI